MSYYAVFRMILREKERKKNSITEGDGAICCFQDDHKRRKNSITEGDELLCCFPDEQKGRIERK